jgi:hypothetical protein
MGRPNQVRSQPPELFRRVSLVYACMCALSLLLLVCAVAPGNAETGVDLSGCNSGESTAARFLLERRVYALADAHRYELPASCPLHRSNDALRVLVDGVKFQRKHWKCQECSKRFTERSFAEAHFRREHLHAVGVGGFLAANVVVLSSCFSSHSVVVPQYFGVSPGPLCSPLVNLVVPSWSPAFMVSRC